MLGCLLSRKVWWAVQAVFVFEISQNSFSCGSAFSSFWSVKYLNLWQSLPIRTAHDTFLESRHPEVTKNPYYVLFLIFGDPIGKFL